MDLLTLLPNAIPLCSPHPVDIGWWGDTSTSFGVGVIIGHFWAVWHWAPGFRVGPGRAFNIEWAEAIAVELGLRMALHLGLIAAECSHDRLFLVHSDNAGIVAVTNKGRSHSAATNSILKHIFALQASNSIRIHMDWFSPHGSASLLPFARSPHGQVDIIVASALSFTIINPQFPQPSLSPSSKNLSLNASPFRPACHANERLFLWWGPNVPPPSTISHPIIEHLASLANRASLRDAASYSTGIRKFHLFCDIFSIPESHRLPASFELLHSFALWAVSDPSPEDPILSAPTATPFEPVSINVAHKYLSAVRAWHITQG
ncbi:hypothetical protein AZE42_12982 [Rhizopogon vesiculosus]|uniref:Uncharacterized protein n=1 Tax=Rhizopogon vesiculosus TaxID=180088 RepID=A0A1J8QZT5_9AGAM|nr:hypothetical protein AZE42_12982 [Rhizopogon vesiculosus]